MHVSGAYAFALCLQEAQEFLEAAMLSASAPEEAFQRFDVLAARHAEALRQLTKKVQDARVSRDTEALKRAVIAYEEALEAYIPGNTSLMPSLSWICGQFCHGCQPDNGPGSAMVLPWLSTSRCR